MHATTWANDPVNSPNHYTRSHPGMECIELTADTSFCLGNAIKYLWRYHGKGRPVEDLEKARWYLCRVIDHDEKIAWTRQQHVILDTLANNTSSSTPSPTIPPSPTPKRTHGRNSGKASPIRLSPASTASSNTKGTNNDQPQHLQHGLHDRCHRQRGLHATRRLHQRDHAHPTRHTRRHQNHHHPQGFTLAEHQIIREAIADALADHGEEL